MKIVDKNIVIISQQDWGTMFISKHHYASELAKMGNSVYYINGPDQENKLRVGEILVEEIDSKLFTIRHRLYFPFNIKFHFKWLYDLLMKRHVDRIVSKIGKEIDIVWSFDISDTLPFDFFVKEGGIKILMPVDLDIHPDIVRRAVKADLIFSVSEVILHKFKDSPARKYFINHGVSDIFFRDSFTEVIKKPLRVGLSGNFLIPTLDRSTLLEIFKSHSDVIFELWGNIGSSNISSAEDMTDKIEIFLDKIRNLPNVVIHGVVPPSELATGLKHMDAFLVAYKDASGTEKEVTNSHKILEYLGTGKVIVSNFIATYRDRNDLIVMVNAATEGNLKVLFAKVIENLPAYNSVEQQQVRVNFARKHSYANQIKKIGHFIDAN